MITINLLPVELRPIKRTPVPYILSALLVAGALVSCYIVWAGNKSEVDAITKDLKANEQELRNLKDSVDQYNQLSEEKQMLAKQLETINEIASDRIIWSRKLYDLSRLALNNMWYSEIEVKTRVTTVIKEVIDPTTKKVKRERVKESRLVLILEAFVSADANGRTSIKPFTEAAAADPEFSSMFELDTFEITDTEFEDASVRGFLLEYVITRGGEK